MRHSCVCFPLVLSMRVCMKKWLKFVAQYFGEILWEMVYILRFLCKEPVYLAYVVFFSPKIFKILCFMWPLLASTFLMILVVFTLSPHFERLKVVEEFMDEISQEEISYSNKQQSLVMSKDEQDFAHNNKLVKKMRFFLGKLVEELGNEVEFQVPSALEFIGEAFLESTRYQYEDYGGLMEEDHGDVTKSLETMLWSLDQDGLVGSCDKVENPHGDVMTKNLLVFEKDQVATNIQCESPFIEKEEEAKHQVSSPSPFENDKVSRNLEFGYSDSGFSEEDKARIATLELSSSHISLGEEEFSLEFEEGDNSQVVASRNEVGALESYVINKVEATRATTKHSHSGLFEEDKARSILELGSTHTSCGEEEFSLAFEEQDNSQVVASRNEVRALENHVDNKVEVKGLESYVDNKVEVIRSTTKHSLDTKLIRDDKNSFEYDTFSTRVENATMDKLWEDEDLVTFEEEKCYRSFSMRMQKDFKRTLACKLFEEHKNRWKETLAGKFYEEEEHPSGTLSKYDTPISSSHHSPNYLELVNKQTSKDEEEMDMLWEEYNDASQPTNKNLAKIKSMRQSIMDSDGEEVPDSPQLCCLKAIRFSAGKMSIKKPTFMKFSKALKNFGFVNHLQRSKVR